VQRVRLSSIKPKKLGFEKLVPKIGTNFRPSKKTGLHQFKKTKSWVPKVGSQFPKIGRREKKLKLATRLLETRKAAERLLVLLSITPLLRKFGQQLNTQLMLQAGW
jgi:hypothetical protein